MGAVARKAASRRQQGRNDALVLEALRQARTPLGAYDLLGRLRDVGPRSPMQIYRALDRLVSDGSVHRIASLSAYAACATGRCGSDGVAVFAICTSCGRTIETHDPALGSVLARLARDQRFRMDSVTVELSGLCGSCAHV